MVPNDSIDRVEVIPAGLVPDTKLEPEEAPARRVMMLPTSISLGHATESGPVADSGPLREGITPVTADFAAGEIAVELSSRCGQCLHFRSEDWAKLRKAWEEGSIAQRKVLDRFVYVMAKALTDSEPTLVELQEATLQLKFCGICTALTEIRRDVQIVHPSGGCPEGMNYYQPRDRAAQRVSSALYDEVMKAAQGK